MITPFDTGYFECKDDIANYGLSFVSKAVESLSDMTVKPAMLPYRAGYITCYVREVFECSPATTPR